MLVMGVLVFGALLVASQANGGPLPGAIFTTTANGSEVNFNIYASKADVYLNGGPGPGAPQTAAGLPDGVYVFMVTDPSGKTLLSQDIAACRRFNVTAGIITALVTSNPTCSAPHLTGVDADEPLAITVQLLPYADTPNNGGEYKAWATPVGNYLCPLTAIDCGLGRHGFVDAFSKTDNFKVKVSAVREIDTRFLDTNTRAFIDGLGITWIDTLGNSNNKWSYYSLSLDVIHEAHVEAPENGTHQIVVQDQTGCIVGTVYLNGEALPNSGPQTVSVKVLASYKNITLRVDVSCN